MDESKIDPYRAVAQIAELSYVKQLAVAAGYRFEVSEDGNTERMIRPDGTVAVIARKKKS